jgi:hypothetical protein
MGCVLWETERGWWREARSDLSVASTLAAKIAMGSPNTLAASWVVGGRAPGYRGLAC